MSARGQNAFLIAMALTVAAGYAWVMWTRSKGAKPQARAAKIATDTRPITPAVEYTDDKVRPAITYAI